MAPITLKNSAKNSEYSLVKSLEKVTFKQAIRKTYGSYEGIMSCVLEEDDMKIKPHVTLLPLTVEVLTKDGTIKPTSFIFKSENCSGTKNQTKCKRFVRECYMYSQIIPKFEHIYRLAGRVLKLAPRTFEIDQNIGIRYLLFENLTRANFKLRSILNGLDMNHMKAALIKLAEYHAASACYVEHHGLYNKHLTMGIYRKINREMLKSMFALDDFLQNLKNWKGGQKYYQKLAISNVKLVDRLLEDQTVNPLDFNVLNHGEFCLKNIFFKYDKLGHIEETLFIGFQAPKYGSPANDLYYLLLTSAADDIKLLHFDYLVEFYFHHLIVNLKILDYQRTLPFFNELQRALAKNGLAAYIVVSKVLPTMVNDSEAKKEKTVKFDEKFTNQKYIKYMDKILPWLDKRGLLDWKDMINSYFVK